MKKLHFKMYKNGKHWVVASIAAFATTTFVGLGNTTASADQVGTTTNSASDSETVKLDSQLDPTNKEVVLSNDSVTADSVTANSASQPDDGQAAATSDAAESEIQTTTSDAAEPETQATTTDAAETETQATTSDAAESETQATTSDAAEPETQATTADAKQQEGTLTTTQAPVTAKSAAVNLAAENQAASTDVSVDVNALQPSSETSPYRPGVNVAYEININNASNNGSIIPKGTKITFSIGTPTNGNMPKFIKPAAANSDSNFDIVNNGDMSFTITTMADFVPGTKGIILNFITQDPGYDWDGSGQNRNPKLVSALVSVTYDYDGTTKAANIMSGQTIYVGPRPYYDPVPAQTPGYVSGNYNGIDYAPDSGYPDGNNNFVGGATDWTNIYVPNIVNADGQPYVATQVNFNPGVRASSGISLTATSNLPIDANHVHLYEQAGDQWIEVTDTQGLTWNITPNEVTVMLNDATDSDGLRLSARNVNLVVYTPVTDPTSQLPETVGYIKWYGWGVGDNPADVMTTEENQLGVNHYAFQPAGTSSTTPWFVGQDVTIYQNIDDNVTYRPTQDLSAFDGVTGNLTDKVVVTDLGGYPADGVNPAEGTYTLSYSVTNDQGNSSTYTRTITVKASEASLSATPELTIRQGEAKPLKDAYQVNATADDGTAVPASAITVDDAAIDVNTPGDYTVTISDGELSTQTVVHVLADQRELTGSDVTIYQGQAVPTDAAAYQATATNIDGHAEPVTVDASAVNNEVPGDYAVVLTTADGQTKTVTVHVVADQKELTGSDVTIYQGQAVPTDAAAYQATATDIDGHAEPVNVDASAVNNQVPGDYAVVLTTADGQTKTVTVHVLATTVEPAQPTPPSNEVKTPVQQPETTVPTESGKTNETVSNNDKPLTELARKVIVKHSDLQGTKLPETGEETTDGLSLLGIALIGFVSCLSVYDKKRKSN